MPSGRLTSDLGSGAVYFLTSGKRETNQHQAIPPFLLRLIIEKDFSWNW